MSWTCKRGVGKLSTRVHSLPHLACVGEEKKEQRKRKRKANATARVFKLQYLSSDGTWYTAISTYELDDLIEYCKDNGLR